MIHKSSRNTRRYASRTAWLQVERLEARDCPSTFTVFNTYLPPRYHRQHDMRRMLLVVEDRLPGGDGLGREAEVFLLRIRIAEVVGIIAAGNLHPDAMPLLEHVSGPAPKG